jgi:predicted HicB family RNase H-like nuclease
MIINYKGYNAQVEIDLEANVLFGRVVDLRTVITFEVDRIDGIRAAFEEAIEEYLEFCAAHGKKPERPYAGNVTLRTSARNHRMFAEASRAAGLSMNAWMERALVQSAESAPHGQFPAREAVPLSRAVGSS